MKSQGNLTNIAHKHLHPAKPIKHWEAHIRTNWNGATQCIDQNNSIAILRGRYGNSVTYKAIR